MPENKIGDRLMVIRQVNGNLAMLIIQHFKVQQKCYQNKIKIACFLACCFGLLLAVHRYNHSHHFHHNHYVNNGLFKLKKLYSLRNILNQSIYCVYICWLMCSQEHNLGWELGNQVMAPLFRFTRPCFTRSNVNAMGNKCKTKWSWFRAQKMKREKQFDTLVMECENCSNW